MDLNIKRTGGFHFPSWQTLPVMGIVGGAVLGGIFSPQIGLVGAVAGFFIMFIIGFQREQEKIINQVEAEYKQKNAEETSAADKERAELLSQRLLGIEEKLTDLQHLNDAVAELKREANRRERVEASETIGSAMTTTGQEVDREAAANTVEVINKVEAVKTYEPFQNRHRFKSDLNVTSTDTPSVSSTDELTNED